MKIFLVTNVELIAYYAPRAHILAFHKYLSQSNDVVLFAMNATKKDIDTIKKLSHFNFIFKTWKDGIFRFRLLLHGLLISFVIIYRILTGGKPDVAYFRSYHTLVLAVVLCKLLRIPIISDIKGIVLHEVALYRKISQLEKTITRTCERIIVKLSNRIIVAQQGITDYLMKNYAIDKNKIDVINNGVDTDIFVPMGRDVAIKKLNLDIKKRYIGFVGNLDKWQGVEYLISMMKAIRNKYPDICLLIVGGGPEKQFIRRLIKDSDLDNSVLLIGSVPQEDVPYYISSCELCFAYKSKLKTGISALKFYEYLACQKPVIASRVGGAEFIEQNRVGELVKQDNLEQLIETTERWINKPREEMQEIGRSGRRLVIENYSWKLVAEKIQRIMTEVINA
ncbi:MAG: glycosyltransferase family 4 protein [Candidatus Omnitrophica bacterium]|nr:glycosyltransferase family 4 protein [Candidatus Omnitrophota bacterium]